MKVYVIEVGCYSDKYILAITSTQEKAEELIEKARDYKHEDGVLKNQPVIKYEIENAEITAYELDTIPIFLQNRIYEIMYCPTHSVEKHIWQTKLRDHEQHWWPPYKIIEEKDYKGDPFYEIPVIAKDKESALKIANEHIMQYIAKGAPNESIS